ncbi:MAG: DUF5329 domain-containing protein [Halobacteriovoraceae bacterium]|nr:DUF5329 domain-containing protein [Halobacteriovoraceae bacterium]
MKILSLLFLFFSAPLWSSNDDIDQQKIRFLLNEVEKSEVIFIRNGEEHPASKAKEHLEHKMKMAKKMFWFFGPERKITVQEFIEKIASSSSTTGEIYKIRLKTGEIVPTGDWLKKKLTDFPKTKPPVDTPKSP